MSVCWLIINSIVCRLNLTGHRAQEVVADAPAIETELKKREGDNDSFAQLKYIQMMAYMMLGQWNEANRISQLMNQMPPQDAAVGRARALLAQAVLCIHTKQEAKPYFDRFMTEAEDARRSSLFMYHELMADYYFVCLYYAMQNKQYKQASEITAKLADVMNNLTEESPIRGVYMQIQFLNKCGDLAYFTHHYQKALDIYESTISLFYEYHANSKVQCYTYMYDWVSTLLLDNDFYKAEQTMRQMGTARQGIIQQAFILALHVLHTDVQAGKELVAHLKTRKLYKSEEFYAPVYCFTVTDEGSHRSRLSTYTKSTHSVVVMRKYLLSSVFCGLCVLGIQAQVTLKGVAVK